MHEARSLTMTGKFDQAIELLETRVIHGSSLSAKRFAVVALGTWYRAIGKYGSIDIHVDKLALS